MTTLRYHYYWLTKSQCYIQAIAATTGKNLIIKKVSKSCVHSTELDCTETEAIHTKEEVKTIDHVNTHCGNARLEDSNTIMR